MLIFIFFIFGGLYLFPFADQGDHTPAKSRANVQKSCHQGGGHIVKEQLGKSRIDGVQSRRNSKILSDSLYALKWKSKKKQKELIVI